MILVQMSCEPHCNGTKQIIVETESSLKDYDICLVLNENGHVDKI
jgi:hypothetical protein